jgi:hypothetical protein
MKKKKTIIDKTVYGGMMVDKYFLHFNDGTDMQVSPREWDQLKVGDEYIIEEVPDPFCGVDPDPFVEALKVPLDKALTEKPPTDWKQMHDMQQKLVISYVLENEKLKDKNKFLEKEVDKLIDESNSLKKLCDSIEEEKFNKICDQTEVEFLYKERDYYKMHSKTANDELNLREKQNKLMVEAIKNFHKAKNRYHSQIACAEMFELVGLPAQYPENYERK